MSQENKSSFWNDVFFKTLPPVLLSLAVFLSTCSYNQRQEEIKKIEIANDFFNEIAEEAEPSEEMLELKKAFIRRVLKDEDTAIINLLERAIYYNYKSKINKSKELMNQASTDVERAAAITELGNAIEKASSFENKEIRKLADDNQQAYKQYTAFKEAEDLNKQAIEQLQNGSVDLAYKKLESVRKLYPNYPGIDNAIQSVKNDKEELKNDNQLSQTRAEELKAITVEPIQEERKTVQDQILLKRPSQMPLKKY